MQHLRSNITLQGGKYRIERVLGQGGFGNTYVGYNTEFEETVAIKEFFMKGVTQRDDNQITVSVSNAENANCFLEQKEKFKKEARRLRKLKNEHIVGVHDLFEENGTAYYVMDYVDGENLAERLKRTGRPMTEPEVNQILPQILDALKAVHDAGFCHLDIKPSNIMLEKGEKVKLIDFGASKQLGANGTLTTNASTAFAQTPGYAPREQIEQSLKKIGPWTDIYALGATLYNLLTNKCPPLPSDIDDDMSEDKHIALPFLESVGAIKFLVLQLMKTNRLQRPQNVDAIEVADKQKQLPISGSHNAENKNWVETSESTDEEGEGTIVADSKSKKENFGADDSAKNGQARKIKSGTYCLLLINLVLFLATIVFQVHGVDLSEYGGLHFFIAEDFYLYQLVTYLFLHSNFMHLLFNMAFLWLFGLVIEDCVGTRRFLCYYLVCGIVGGFFQELSQFASFYWTISSQVTGANLSTVMEYGSQYAKALNTWTTIGSSIAVFAIILAFGMIFSRRKVFSIPVSWLIISYVFIELLSLLSSSGDGIAHQAQLGAMLCGFFIIVYWKRKNILVYNTNKEEWTTTTSKSPSQNYLSQDRKNRMVAWDMKLLLITIIMYIISLIIGIFNYATPTT